MTFREKLRLWEEVVILCLMSIVGVMLGLLLVYSSYFIWNYLL